MVICNFSSTTVCRYPLCMHLDVRTVLLKRKNVIYSLVSAFQGFLLVLKPLKLPILIPLIQ